MLQIAEATLIFAITASIAMLGFVSTAFGYDNPDMEVEFKQLDAQMKSSGLLLDYKVAKKDWKQLKKTGIQPRLNLYTRTHGGSFDFRYSVPLSARSGSIGFPKEIKLRGNRDIEIELIGFSGFNRIARSTFGERCQPRLRLNVSRKKPIAKKHHKRPKHHKPPKHSTAKLVEACGDHAPSHGVSQCVSSASALRSQDAVAVVKACGEHTRYGSDFNRCMKEAAGLQHSKPAATVRACGDATKWPSELTSCLSDAKKFVRFSPASSVKACDAATKYNSDFRRCVKQSQSLGRGGDDIIRACGDATRYSSEFHQCVKDSARVRRQHAVR